VQWLNLSQSYLNIVLVVSAILGFASIVNTCLVFNKKDSLVFKKISIIIRSWWVIATVIVTAGFFGKYGFLLIFIFIIFLILKEFFHGAAISGIKRYLQILSGLYTLILAYFIHIENFDLFSSFPFLYLICTVPLLLLIKGTVGYLPKLLASYFGILFIIQCVLYLPVLVFVGPKFFGDLNQAILLFFLVIGLTQANDVFQFIFGKLFGKNKIVPHLSPNKTEAGFIGGVLSTTIVGACLFNYLLGFDLGFSILLSFSVSLFGIFGDLTFSATKRYFGIKDFSDILPGHGGVIDRLDSIIFSGPIIFHIIKFYTNINL